MFVETGSVLDYYISLAIYCYKLELRLYERYRKKATTAIYEPAHAVLHLTEHLKNCKSHLQDTYFFPFHSLIMLNYASIQLSYCQRVCISPLFLIISLAVGPTLRSRN